MIQITSATYNLLLHNYVNESVSILNYPFQWNWLDQTCIKWIYQWPRIQKTHIWFSLICTKPFVGCNGHLAKHVNLLVVAHAPGVQETFSPPPLVSDHDMHYGMCLTHVPWCMPRSITSGFLWCRWRGKRFRHIRNLHFYVSGERHMYKNGC